MRSENRLIRYSVGPLPEFFGYSLSSPIKVQVTLETASNPKSKKRIYNFKLLSELVTRELELRISNNRFDLHVISVISVTAYKRLS